VIIAIAFLVVFPLVAAALLMVVRHNTARNIIVTGSAAIIGLASIALAIGYFMVGENRFIPYELSSTIIDYACSGIGVLIAICILAYAIRYKNLLAGILAFVQVGAALVFEFVFAHNPQLSVSEGVYVDPLSLMMVLIIGVIGSGIILYSIGYMEDFQSHHPDQKDRRHIFFALMFLFLAAMFGVIFSDNILWLFTAWEITTVCSFLLIGYTKTEEAIKNSFRQVIMNLSGGIGFIAAIYFIAFDFGTLSFSTFLAEGVLNPSLAAIPVICLAFAGVTKAAQMPFQSWLLGAMVAPTPTSALLHSSTMVKAGVFLLVKLSPIFAAGALNGVYMPGIMVILVGGITFMFASFMAISQSNAKRVLAYSTVANLGLIVACAGVGTPEAIWAATFLILFHAIAKSLLFLAVGTAEHNIGSRNIEDMDLLFERMPQLARYMMLGIFCMFIAPFGMLIAKWATLVTFVDTQQIPLIILLVFGSGATFMFWGKWLGKLAGIAGNPENKEMQVHKSEWVAIWIMALLVVVCCVGLPVISYFIADPYISGLVAANQSVYAHYPYDPTISMENLIIASVATVFIIAVLFAGLGRGKQRKVNVYLSGISINNEDRTFINSLSKESEATARNWYMEPIFGESRVGPIGTISAALIIILCFGASILMMPGLF